jgi:translation elongation factor EF-1alpha
VAEKLRNPISFARVPSLFQLKTDKFNILVEGCSGQKGFLDNLVNRKKANDIHVGVVVLAPGAKFPTDAVDAAAKQQIALAKMVGVKNLVIAVNRMDVQRYSQALFNQMIYELEKYLNEIQYSLKDVQIVPVSAAEGENLTANLGKMRWYMGTRILSQPTLIEAIVYADKNKISKAAEDQTTTTCSKFEVLALAHDDVGVGYSGKFRVLPDNFKLYLENSVDGVVDDVCFKVTNDRGVCFSDEEPKVLKKGQMGILQISTSEPVTILTSYECPPLSRFHCMTSHIIRISGVAIPDVERKGKIWTPTHALERSVFFV